MSAASRSTGDLLADRRYAYAEEALRNGDALAAADLAAQTLERAPDFAPALALLGRAKAVLGEPDAALAALARAVLLEPDDTLGVRLDLARLGAVPTEAAIGPAYVRALFDEYAVRFDRHLVRSLRYRAPELLADALRRTVVARGGRFHFARVLDLGCGTGLMGRALAGRFDALAGVDLSPRMLAQAARTKLYDALHEGDLAAFLAAQPAGRADLVVAADVFVYMADLAPAFAEAHRVLGQDGLFAFTVQAHAGEGVALGEDARYAHGEAYLREAAATAGFAVARFEAVSTRQDRGVDVPGFLIVLAR